jgi:hypothetical protein
MISFYYNFENLQMSEQLGPKKSLLKFKPTTTFQSTAKAPILHKAVIQ